MEKTRKLPKNVCQMGERDARMRVYLEDYVNVFMKKMVAEDAASVGVFLGERRILEGESCLFVRGALVLEGAVTPGGSIRVDETVRTSMEQKATACFPGNQIVGWFVSGAAGEDLDFYQYQKIKRQLLLARETLFCANGPEERHFYWMTGEDCLSLLGYYIYYETNRNMQEYMLVTSLSHKVEIKEQETARVVRQVLEEHQEARRRRFSGRLAYGLCAVLTVALAASGAVILQKKAMPGLQQETEAQVNVDPGETQGGVIIQEVQGNVYPTVEDTAVEDTTETIETTEATGDAE